MSVTIKSAEEIELMRQAGKYLAKVHQELERAIKPGISTWEIDKIGEETIRSLGCEPNFLNYQAIRHPSVYRSTTKLFMEFQEKTILLRKAIS